MFETPCFLIAYNGPNKQNLIKKLREYKEYKNNIEKNNSGNIKEQHYWPEIIVVLNKDREYCIIREEFCVIGENPWIPRMKHRYGRVR